MSTTGANDQAAELSAATGIISEVEFDPARLQDSTPLRDVQRFPSGRHPYYIVTPRYTRFSAGIKALHLLCHCLNRAGQEAYLIIWPAWLKSETVCPGLLTPEVDPAVIARHRAAGVSPIVVYPEKIAGNPLGAATVVRYVMNFPGLLGGDKAFPPTEIVFGYSQALARAGNGRAEDVLFMPVSDASIYTPDPPRQRQGSCFYGMKYREVHGGEWLPVTAESIEITRERPDSLAPAQLAELFRASEVFYAYENTALTIEAALCLCPTVFLPNPWLTEVIAAKELGWDGFAWGTDPAEIARAKATVQRLRERYLATYATFWDQLAAFVARTQARATDDSARQGFPATMPWRARWQPWIALTAWLIHATATVWRSEGWTGVLRKLRFWIARDGRVLMRRVRAGSRRA